MGLCPNFTTPNECSAELPSGFTETFGAGSGVRPSVSYFSRALRRSVGVAPHNWLLTFRVEVAKQKLRDGRLSLRDVALACGFADQSQRKSSPVSLA
jgi:methylphosphotriester-DNA--protein-cysteine methyltransferase